jgi:uncharacterized protein DUF5675
MRLTLQRDSFTDTATMGELFIGTEHVCFTLELPNKDGLPGSCIPQGIYPVQLLSSPKFMASHDPFIEQYAVAMPHIVKIPNRSLIMVHFGNNVQETDGCVLVGADRSGEMVLESRAAFKDLYTRIEADAKAGNCDIEVLGGAVVSPADLGLEGDL